MADLPFCPTNTIMYFIRNILFFVFTLDLTSVKIPSEPRKFPNLRRKMSLCRFPVRFASRHLRLRRVMVWRFGRRRDDCFRWWTQLFRQRHQSETASAGWRNVSGSVSLGERESLPSSSSSSSSSSTRVAAVQTASLTSNTNQN